MQLHITQPLTINSLSGKTVELMPVVMTGIPSSNSEIFLAFLKLQGKRIEIDDATADRCQRYMRQHRTEALSEDGITAFTICDALVECLPDDANRLLASDEESQ